MAISKEDDMSSWEKYHIILLSHIVMYRIWSLLDSDKTLVVTRVSPPIFGLKLCFRFPKRMQLNMGGLRLNLVFLLQPMVILIGLSLCHKFQLHFMSLMPQIKGTFIKIECFKIKPCPSQKKMTRVRGSNIT